MSEVSICNQALGWLGANLITSFDDPDSTEAALCKANYAAIRDAVLEAVDWSFARTRVVLSSPEVQEPAFGFAFSHVVPVDCLRVINADDTDRGGDNLEWEYEDRRILCDSQIVYVKYTRIIDATARFSALFTQALANRLAADFAIPLAESAGLQQQHWAIYTAKMDEAATIDGLQGRYQQTRSRKLKRIR